MIQKLTKDTINTIFEENTEREERLLAMFKQVIPNWDKVVKLNHYPRVHKKTWGYICDKFLDKPRGKKHHDGLFWMNYGFGSDDDLNVPEWEVHVEEDQIIYEEESCKSSGHDQLERSFQ